MLESDPVLFGADTTQGVVAVELAGDDEIVIFTRRNGTIHREKRPFYPFMIVENPSLAKRIQGVSDVKELQGRGSLRFLIHLSGWSFFEKACKALPKLSGRRPSGPQAPFFCPNDPVHQFMLLQGTTCFLGMDYQDPVRLQLDIETLTAQGYTFPNPNREQDSILSVAVRDNRGTEQVLWAPDLGEKGVILKLNALIQKIDPDVIEGHNLFKFDLDYLRVRAQRYGLSLAWGRDGSDIKVRSSRIQVAERKVDYPRADVWGRSVVDTWILAQFYDVAHRDIQSYGLKNLAIQFGLASENRTYLEVRQLSRLALEDSEAVKAYNLDDVRETAALSEILGASMFMQAKLFPYSYQNVMVRGNATKIDGLLVREYLRQSTALPLPKRGSVTEGGYTDIFFTGVAENVVHCDVQSLYPSIMLSMKLGPKEDELEVFHALLFQLRSFRLDCKQKAQQAESVQEKRYFEGMQQAFKVVINSFYGYLGTEIHHFSDPGAASDVTATGRDLLRAMIRWLEKEGCQILELDTDGIYFVPPVGMEGEDREASLVERLSDSLPEGILVEYAGRYQTMWCYKMKNYALLGYDGEIVIKGSALRSRGLQPFLRSYMQKTVKAILRKDSVGGKALYEETRSALQGHKIPVEALCKTQTLGESLERYAEKVAQRKRNRSAVHELAIQSGRAFVPGDQITYYITGSKRTVRIFEQAKLLSDHDPNHPDENVPYYLAKLDEVYKKFLPYLTGEGQTRGETELFPCKDRLVHNEGID